MKHFSKFTGIPLEGAAYTLHLGGDPQEKDGKGQTSAENKCLFDAEAMGSQRMVD